jgi:hypothetical protein
VDKKKLVGKIGSPALIPHRAVYRSNDAILVPGLAENKTR